MKKGEEILAPKPWLTSSAWQTSVSYSLVVNLSGSSRAAGFDPNSCLRDTLSFPNSAHRTEIRLWDASMDSSPQGRRVHACSPRCRRVPSQIAPWLLNIHDSKASRVEIGSLSILCNKGYRPDFNPIIMLPWTTCSVITTNHLQPSSIHSTHPWPITHTLTLQYFPCIPYSILKPNCKKVGFTFRYRSAVIDVNPM